MFFTKNKRLKDKIPRKFSPVLLETLKKKKGCDVVLEGEKMKYRGRLVVIFCLLIAACSMFVACDGAGFTVKFDLAGGELKAGEIEQKVSSADDIEAPNVAKTGYELDGWSVDPKSVNGDTTIQAKWKLSEYTISYNLDGGSWTVEPPVSYNIEFEDVVLPSPEKEGAEFLGWTYQDSSTPKVGLTIKKGSWGNKIFTAKWSSLLYSVSFNANGGTGSMESVTSEGGVNIRLEKVSFVRDGYDFLGWAESATGTAVVADGGEYTVPNRNVILYAVWESKTTTYVVEKYFENTSGEYVIDNSLTESKSAKVFSSVSVTPSEYEKYKVNGQKSVLEGTVAKDGSLTLKIYYALTVTVTFDANGGSGSTLSCTFASFEQNKKLTPNGFSNEGKLFKGWALTKDGAVVYENEAEYDGNSDITLYAVWNMDDYITVKFDLGGGTIEGETSVSDFYVGYGEPLGDKLKTPEKENYEFIGWFWGDEEITSETELKYCDNITIVARFAAKFFTIKYDLKCVVSYTFILGQNKVIEEINCTYDKNATLSDEKVQYGEKFSLDSTKISTEKEDFGFEYFYIVVKGSEIKIDENTVFNQNLIGDSSEITVRVKCKYLQSPIIP